MRRGLPPNSDLGDTVWHMGDTVNVWISQSYWLWTLANGGDG